MCEVRGDSEAAEHSLSPLGWVLRVAEMWGAVSVGSEKRQFVRLGVIRSQVSHFYAVCYWTSLATSRILGSLNSVKQVSFIIYPSWLGL